MKCVLLTGYGWSWSLHGCAELMRLASVAWVQYQPPRESPDVWEHETRAASYVEPIKTVAASLQIETRCLQSANTAGFADALRDAEVTHVICLGYGEILSPETLASGPVFVNFHPSWLPEHRGHNPFASVILNGEERTGITVHRMTARIDDGDYCFREPVAVSPRETFVSLCAKMSITTREVVNAFVAGASSGTLSWKSLGDQRPYHPRHPADFFHVDLSSDSLLAIDRKVRAYGETGSISMTWQGRLVFPRGSDFFQTELPSPLQRQIDGGPLGCIVVREHHDCLVLHPVHCRHQAPTADELLWQRVLTHGFSPHALVTSSTRTR